MSHSGLTELEQRVLEAKARGESVCLGCGCTDSQACAGGCSWIFVSRRRGIGVCSCCEVKPGPSIESIQDTRRLEWLEEIVAAVRVWTGESYTTFRRRDFASFREFIDAASAAEVDINLIANTRELTYAPEREPEPS